MGIVAKVIVMDSALLDVHDVGPAAATIRPRQASSPLANVSIQRRGSGWTRSR